MKLTLVPTAPQADRSRWKHVGGWPRLPQRWWRLQRFHDAWLCLVGRASLHRAWQTGYDQGGIAEYTRATVNRGK